MMNYNKLANIEERRMLGLGSSAALQPQRSTKNIRVYDLSSEKKPEKCLQITDSNLNRFVELLRKEFLLHRQEGFVLTTTDRKILDTARFESLPDGSTIYLLKQRDQDLPWATVEQIDFTPHYNTLTNSGSCVYYASEDQKSLPYALAELIDNSLSATSKNTGARTVEIRMIFDETLGKPAVIVLDNGRGMTSKQLNNWAVYRLSKFMRENGTFGSETEGYVRPGPVPRSLNSDISYFGVGGKQAAFHIGSSVRMISKPVGFPDVHELILSKEEFERKEKNKEHIYKEVIRNRKPGDSSHVNMDERFLHGLIAEEVGKESFTAVVITGVKHEHISSLKKDFTMWTTELAHIYHYYIHGVNGNVTSSLPGSDDPTKIDIQITLREKANKCPCAINLREVDCDMQTLYINTAADTFEFRASTGLDNGTVEGLLRYHPFLYDRETYPEDQSTKQDPVEEDDLGMDPGLQNKARGKRPIFECFWNGRLIPYTTVFEFDWCSLPTKVPPLPAECYSRFSGVLFTDDKFEVSTNKLKFMDLEMKLKNKDTIFTTVMKGQKSAKRSNIQREFTQWLQSCHKKYDKQVKFMGYQETITRADVTTKKMQHPWATFTSIEWDRKIYKIGQLVKSHKTQPIIYGTVARFLLFGDHDRDVYATGGQVEVIREPRALYNQTKIIPISKIDKSATDEAITNNINNDLTKLPEKLIVDWPDKNPWPQRAVYPAGTPLGPFKIDIHDKNGKTLSRMPSGLQLMGPKLSIKLQLVLHDPKGDKEIVSFVASHSSKWGFWFNKIENLSDLGKYTLTMSTMISDSNATEYGGRTLPSYALNFTIKEGVAESFDVGELSPSFYVGIPFNIPLLMKDRFGHSATPPPKLQPELKCRGLHLDLSSMTVDTCGSTVTIRGVKARGKVHAQSKTCDIHVTLPGLTNSTQTFRVSLLPGNPHSIHVTPEENPVTMENGNTFTFNIEIHDEAGNITARPKQIVTCQVQGFPQVANDCSSTGKCQMMTKPINLKIIKGEPQRLKVQFELPSQKGVASVVKELEVVPSTRVARMELYCQSEDSLVLRNNEKIDWPAGGVLENLHYKLYDEADREVPLTADTASKIKVNWTRDGNRKALILGRLPDVQVAVQVTDERFYQVSYQEQNVSVGFTVVPCPDEPVRLRPSLPQNTVKLGETLPGDINLELVDRHGNATKTLTPACVRHMTVEADCLDKSGITFTWQGSSSSVVLTGVRFHSGSLGPRELCFRYCSYVERTTIRVIAGLASQLKLVRGPEQPLQVLNDHGISTPFLVQLCDEWGNASPDQRVVVDLRSSPQTLKVMADVTSQPVNAKGEACFNVTSVSGPKGYYQLEFKGLFNNKPIPGPTVNLTIIPDPHKPVRLALRYDKNAKFLAGGTFPVFSVTVVSDEGSPITTFNPDTVSMFVWKRQASQKTSPSPPPTAIELKCSKPLANDRNDCFYFRDKEIPQQVGEYRLQFSLRIERLKILHSEQVLVRVMANQPVKLRPSTDIPTPVVSYSSTVQPLVENATLKIMDSYGNPAGEDLDGQIVVFIKCKDEDGNKSLPMFEGKAKSCHVSLVGGVAHISRLAVMERSPGEHGCSYVLLFKPEVPTCPTPLDPFELQFLYQNNEENQQKMTELTRKREELSKEITTYKNNLMLRQQIYDETRTQHMNANKKEATLRMELTRRNMPFQQSASISDIESVLKKKSAEADTIRRTSRRVCPIEDKFRGQLDVLGKVGCLAVVEDDVAAWVISWLISGDMNCVITKTTEAAQRIYRDTQGQQEVMALDAVHVYPSNRPLPHIRNGRELFDPVGNPVYARDLLKYPHDQDSCEKLFKNLLGDTILIDDLDSATSYRRSVVQNKMPCPTILTRQGNKISSKGKFGGAHNKAPPRNRLVMFGAPLPQDYFTIMDEIELLSQYKLSLQKREKAEQDLKQEMEEMRSPETLKKQQKLQEATQKLKEIDSLLASTPVRPATKRLVENTGETSEMSAKRARQRFK